MMVFKVPHLPRKSTLRCRKRRACHAKRRRHFDPGCRQGSADLYDGLQSATPATQIDPEVPKVPCLSRKTLRRHVDPGCRQGSADLYEGLQSATPATQIDPEVPKAPRLSRKTPRHQFDPGCRQGSADLCEGLQSAMPATQIESEDVESTTSVTQNAAASFRPRMSPSFR